MYQLLVPIVFAASVLAAGPVALPSNFKSCSRSSPNFNECLKPAIQSALTDLVKGSRPLGILSIDPLLITSVGIDQGTGSVAIKLDFVNLNIIGLSKVIIESVDAQLDGDEKKLTLTLRTDDVLALVGKYTIEGKVLILPISGTGDARIELLGATATITFVGKTVVKDGDTYMLFHGGSLNLNPKNVTLHFAELFNGDKVLGDNMNKFLNENWKDVYTELKKPIEETFITTFINIANRFFSKVLYHIIFPQ